MRACRSPLALANDKHTLQVLLGSGENDLLKTQIRQPFTEKKQRVKGLSFLDNGVHNGKLIIGKKCVKYFSNVSVLLEIFTRVMEIPPVICS